MTRRALCFVQIVAAFSGNFMNKKRSIVNATTLPTDMAENKLIVGMKNKISVFFMKSSTSIELLLIRVPRVIDVDRVKKNVNKSEKAKAFR